ncbi:hypothetical protein ABOONEI_2478 [Aciduliprofundum boonei T469]|nr:hypothetical protein ABOONEI_2478 [Aciduliprofundum boonei T469]
MDGDTKIQIIVRRGREVRKKVFKRYLSSSVPLSKFFEDVVSEFDSILKELLRRW